MYMVPNETRLQRLRLAGHKLNNYVTFCPECDFQYDPGEFGPNACPDCRHHPLHNSKVTDDLVELCARYALHRHVLAGK